MDTESMSFSKVISAQLHLLQSHLIDVEVDISRGLSSFSIVGLPDKAVEEAKDRVSAAIKNSGFESPKSKNHKLVISLAPAELRKEGPNFDLAIAVAYLLSVEDVSFDPKGKLFLGQLSLDGSIRPIKGVLSLVIGAREKGITEIFIPYQNREEVLIIKDVQIFAVSTLLEVVEHLNGLRVLIPIESHSFQPKKETITIDFQEIKGQESAKRALEIAAAGGHNLIMYGPPGTGKTLLAKAFPFLLPPLTFDEMIEVTTIHASSSKSQVHQSSPFRSPHHSASYAAIIGGGNYPRAGEITLAHRGVLFMDEFPEFDSKILESLRQPLEEQIIHISRAKNSITFPADFILIASMNPCPCGYLGSRKRECVCTMGAVRAYQRKISGPIADRIDMWIEVTHVPYEKLNSDTLSESTEDIKKRVLRARHIQNKRNSLNSRLDSKSVLNYCSLDSSCKKLLDNSSTKLGLSPRMYHRILKLSRTIADLDNKKELEEKHILEALQYRFRMD